MPTLPVLVFAALVAVQDPTPAQEPAQSNRAGATVKSDQTVNVPKGARVELRDCVGEIVVKTWNRDAVQVRSVASRRGLDVKATLNEKVLTIGGKIDPAIYRDDVTVDYELLVPAWIELRLEGRECGIEVDGVAGNITVTNTEGDIVLRGVDGTVDATSIDGDIEVDGGKGRIKATSSDGDITISNASGEIEVNSIDGDITLSALQSASVDASSVDGEIQFSGTLQASGKYHFTSHDGDVVLSIPENSSATFSIRRFGGDLHTSLPLKPVGDVRSGRRGTYTLGSGSAQVTIETFDGDVRIQKPGEKKK